MDEASYITKGKGFVVLSLLAIEEVSHNGKRPL